MIVLDASAILAFLRQEPGSGLVAQAITDGACCSTASWSELVQKSLQAGRDVTTMRQALESCGLVFEPVTKLDAEKAAELWVDHPSVSLSGRLCLALAHRLGAVTMTADSAWGTSSQIQQIR
ncbi:MAG: PIN domain-containing protein [Propionibacteriaceae bacterium]|nr:PIN domain-containing protein [Propionibacteriaceae bacterium]